MDFLFIDNDFKKYKAVELLYEGYNEYRFQKFPFMVEDNRPYVICPDFEPIPASINPTEITEVKVKSVVFKKLKIYLGPPLDRYASERIIEIWFNKPLFQEYLTILKSASDIGTDFIKEKIVY